MTQQCAFARRADAGNFLQAGLANVALAKVPRAEREQLEELSREVLVGLFLLAAATVEPDQWFALDRRASIYPPLGQVLTDALANLPALTARLAPAARARNLRQFGETQMLTRYQRLLTQVLPPGEPAGPHLRCGQARP